MNPTRTNGRSSHTRRAGGHVSDPPAHLVPTQPPAAGAVDSAAPQVCDDMTVEVALAVMAGARTDHVRVCDDDDQCTGLVTAAQLTTARDSAAYTDRLRLRDIAGRRPCASPRRPHQSV